jgi:hypothetical protein
MNTKCKGHRCKGHYWLNIKYTQDIKLDTGAKIKTSQDWVNTKLTNDIILDAGPKDKTG